MTSLPACLFIVDPPKEKIALAEAQRMGIPVVAIADTSCNPDEIDYPIPANDDAIRAIKLICSKIADAVLEGKASRFAMTTETAPEGVPTEAKTAGLNEPVISASDEQSQLRSGVIGE